MYCEKKHPRRKLLAMLMAIVMCFSACGESGGDNSSDDSAEPMGFNEATNQIVTIGGIMFSIPAYYDYLHPESTEDNLHYLSTNESCTGQLFFSSKDTRLTPAAFDTQKQEIAESFARGLADGFDMDYTVISIKEIDEAELSEIHLTASLQKEDTGRIIYCNLALIHNYYAGMYINILQLTEGTDQSSIDYNDDFSKILASSTRIEENADNTTANTSDDILESLGIGNNVMPGSGDLGDFYVEIKEGTLARDYDGNRVCIITYSWTNNSDETTCAMYKILEKAFQDGVELDAAYFILDTSVYNSGTKLKEVRPGATTDIQCAFILSNDTSPVEFELSESLNLSKDTTRVVKIFTMS